MSLSTTPARAQRGPAWLRIVRGLLRLERNRLLRLESTATPERAESLMFDRGEVERKLDDLDGCESVGDLSLFGQEF